ncbi:MAG: hypothetical protein IKW34_00515 [Clostridia bacterium]|nr:hypothetical protein [Clostridia bacterium]
MAERIPDSLIDEILASAKNYINDETYVDYSEEKIDSLIAEISKEKKDSAVTEKTVVVPPFKKEKKEFSLNMSAVSFADESDEDVKVVPEKTGNVGVRVTDDGQIGLMSDGVEISNDADEEVPEVIEKEELKSVSGQISIEKTRKFNEVDIRGAYNPNISHNLGNKVTRTTTGEAQPLSTPVMADEKYRNHFMNKPVQNIEKTQEHRKLIESLPQKTIETPGVVVKKNRDVISNTDGIEPMPTIVPAEYELEQEKTRLDLPKAEKAPDNQMMFEGFNEDEEKGEFQTEEQAEEQVRKNRKQAVEDFMNGEVLFKQDVPEETPKKRFDRQKNNFAHEYLGPKEKAHVEEDLEKEKQSLTAKTVVLSIICFVMSVLALVAGA